MTTGSPIPERWVEERLRRDGCWAWHFFVEGSFRGGPYPTREQAEARMAEWDQELDDLYEAVEERARRDGVTVQW